MKKLSIKKISFLFLSIALVFCAFFGITTKQTAVSAEGEAPEYFTVVQSPNPEGVGINIEHNKTAFIGNNETVVAKLYHEDIVSITPYFMFNGKTYSNAVLLDQFGIAVDYQTTSFTITSSNADSKTPYGKYELNISYLISQEDGTIVDKSFNFTYYVLLRTDYFNGTSVNITTNKASVGSSGMYDNIYMFNYQDTNASQTTMLPEISFNYRRFIVTVTKNFQSVEKTQTFAFNGTEVVVSGDNVVLYTKNDANVKMVFNDLGSYDISYSFIYCYDNNIDNLSTYTTYSGKKRDRVDMYGYQLMYSDINTNGSKEFKNISETGVLGEELTDISYLIPNAYSADTVLTAINNKNIKIQETNQGPVSFKYNSELITANIVTDENSNYLSKVFMLDGEPGSYSIKKDNGGKDVKYNYENEPLTQAGIYLIRTVYSYSAYVGAGITNLPGDGRVVFVQWFAFEITDHTPSVEIQEAKLSETGEIEDLFDIISDGSFTNKDVKISKLESSRSIFNAPTKLVVYTRENYVGAYDAGVEVSSDSPLVVSKNANYIVTLYFGKNLSRSYSSEFTIDKNAIENIQTFTAVEINNSGFYQNTNTINFFTNQAVSVLWNEKASGVKTHAYYKYIPLVSSNELFDDATLKQYYDQTGEKYNIPTSYYFDYDNLVGELTGTKYNNSASYVEYIPSLNILSQNGMYIFRIYDEAGNEAYMSFIIDNTAAPILQMVDGKYVDTNDLNIVSNDVTIHFGQNRVTKFNNLVYKNGLFETNDAWLNTVLNNGASEYFTILSINTKTSYYTTAKINTNVLVDDGAQKFHTISKENHYGYEIKFIDESTNTAIEKQYDFYVRDAINTKTLAGQSLISPLTYTELYSATHTVKISSDASLTELFYYNTTGNRRYLSQDSYAPTPADGIKQTYYKPTTITTLASSNEILHLTFNPTPEEGTIEISKVTYTFQPFATRELVDASGNKTYSYYFDEKAKLNEITIYNKANSSENKTTSSQTAVGMLEWEVQKEYNSLTSSYQTKPGKYTITRTYDTSLANYDSAISEKFDYTTRTLTFIVDRNGIISAPVVVNDSGETSNYVGEPIKIQVLENDVNTNTTAMFFKDVYLATNITTGSSTRTILSTNKLPVQVYIPAYKYGYSYTDGSQFISEDSINTYNKSAATQDYESKISTYKLSAEIRYSTSLSGLAVTSTVYYGKIDTTSDSNYLVFDNNSRAFTKVGYYQVTINQGNSITDRNTFTFTFQITESKPEFNINTIDDVALQQSSNGNYYTNKDKIRLQWIDPSNEFIAKINKSMISYSINNGKPVTIDALDVQTSGNINTLDVDLKEIGAYTNGSRITFNMQFEGNEANYNEGFFKSSKTVIVDTVAPTANISKLVSLSGLNYSDVRKVTEKYNASVSSGVYKYYSYNVSIEDFSKIINIASTDTTETYVMGYRVFETSVNGVKTNTKYNDIYSQETDPSIIEQTSYDFTTITEATLSDLLDNNLKYVEIYEKDLAGNVTVYTIYLTSEATLDSASAAISYITNEDNKYIYQYELAANMNLFAKGSLSINKIQMFNSSWLSFEYNRMTYLRTPYTDGKFYNLAKYDSKNPSASLVDISTFANIAPSSKVQEIKLSLVPRFNTITLNVSVLNTTLSVLHSTQTTYNSQEGVLIQIPNTTDASVASIYAISVVISHYVTSPTNELVPQVLYTNTSPTFFKTVQAISSSSILNAEYVQYMGGTYLKFTIASPVANRFYKYEVIDNFGDKYSLTNIYGSEEIVDELKSTVTIKQNYEEGELFHYSTKNTNFKFNSAKDRVILTITTSLFTYGPYDVTKDDLSGLANFVELIKPAKNSSVYTLVLKAAPQTMAEGKIGDQITYKLDMYEAIDTTSTIPYKNLNVRIYNIIPSITLYGVENDNQNELFNKGTIYGNQLRITFNQEVGKYPCTIWLDKNDGTTPVQISSGTVVSKPATYTIIIKYAQMFTEAEYNVKLNFTISDNEEDFYNVVYSNGTENLIASTTGSPYTYTIAGRSRTIATHYILNTTNFEIVVNTSQGVMVSEPETINASGYTSYIYLITNVGSPSAGSKYFSRTIAITVIPQSSNIVSGFYHIEDNGDRNTLNGSLATFVVSKEETNTYYERIAWNSYFGIPENKIKATIYYGNKNTTYDSPTEAMNNLSVVTLNSSGTYYVTFTDLAGNTHLFENFGDSYEIRYLRSVIYTINGESPINNSVYNGKVTVEVPSYTTKYYDDNARPRIQALRNGAEYKVSSDKNNVYTFDTPGLYKVWFSAATGGIQINEDSIYFLIVNDSESRWAYEFSEYGNYYIKEVIKNPGTEIEENITRTLATSNMGNLVYKDTVVIEDGEEKIVSLPYNKNILLSVFDKQTGVGKYQITIATDNAFNQEFTFSIWINNTIPPIEVSVPENTPTTNEITVSFNTKNLLEAVGECILRINGLEKDMHFTYAALEAGDLNETYTLRLTADSEIYNIQVLSQSGKLLYSYRAIKTAPLNTISIILIVVGVVVAIALTFIFIRLRKKLKIR